MSKLKTIYSFIGLPASGKGTQAAILAKKLGAKVIGIGDLIRTTIDADNDDPFVVEIRDRYNKGIPQPDSVAIDLVKSYLAHIDSDVIFDNFPFSVGQSKFIDDYIGDNPRWQIIIMYLELDPETVIKRITSRKICASCGTIYESSDEMICEKCGGALIVRSDDNEDVARTRIGQYLPKIKEVLTFFEQKNGKVIRIDGEKSIEEVSREITEKL
ncbi:MAG: nucleoside monophosphate kinase [bacterium]|nr:nucleoside monophosphate kinase [bacterium]